MTVNVIIEGALKEGERENFTGICSEAFKVTRAFDGCQSIDLVYNSEKQNNWLNSLLIHIYKKLHDSYEFNLSS